VARKRRRSAGYDTQVLTAVHEDDPQAWTQLIRRQAPAVRAVARLVFERYGEPVGEDDIDAVVLEVFERVAADRFQWLRSLSTSEMLGPSVRTLAAWRALGLLRTKYRVFTCSLESEVKLGSRHVATAVLARPPSKERAPYLNREDVDRLMAEFLEDLGERPRRLLTKVYAFRKPYKEIAGRDGMPVTSVAQTLFEARKRLAEELAKAAPEAGL
jgi:RNA polymerase sigma factor (sigma-70 family)